MRKAIFIIFVLIARCSFGQISSLSTGNEPFIQEGFIGFSLLKGTSGKDSVIIFKKITKSGNEWQNDPVRIFEGEYRFSTINGSDTFSFIPFGGKETYLLKKVKLTENKTTLLLSWNVCHSADSYYTQNQLWDLDTHKKIFCFTNNYQASSRKVSYEILANTNELDSTVDFRSMTYNCDFSVDKKGAIRIKNSTLKRSAVSNALWLREGGVYSMKNGEYVLFKNQ